MMIVPGKIFGAIATLAGAAALAAQAEGMGNLAVISGGLSLGAIASAIGSFYVSREKTNRNERDIQELARTMEKLSGSIHASVVEMRTEIRADLKEHREQTRETIKQLVDVVNARASSHRATDSH